MNSARGASKKKKKKKEENADVKRQSKCYLNLEHNYKLALLSKRHLLRYSRRISKPKVGLIDFMVNVGISTKNTYLYLIEEVGGSEDVGFTKKDDYNH